MVAEKDYEKSWSATFHDKWNVLKISVCVIIYFFINAKLKVLIFLTTCLDFNAGLWYLSRILKALKSSTEVELVDERIRCKTDPERWPIPTPTTVGSPRTDFSQLINCPEFVPRQTLNATNSSQYPNDILSANLMM